VRGSRLEGEGHTSIEREIGPAWDRLPSQEARGGVSRVGCLQRVSHRAVVPCPLRLPQPQLRYLSLSWLPAGAAHGCEGPCRRRHLSEKGSSDRQAEAREGLVSGPGATARVV